MTAQKTTTKKTTESTTKVEKIIATSCLPMKSFGKSKSFRPLKVKTSRLRPKVAN